MDATECPRSLSRGSFRYSGGGDPLGAASRSCRWTCGGSGGAYTNGRHTGYQPVGPLLHGHALDAQDEIHPLGLPLGGPVDLLDAEEDAAVLDDDVVVVRHRHQI